MKLRMDVSGLVLVVRWWPKGTSNVQMMEHDDRQLSHTDMLGVGTAHADHSEGLARHHATLSVPVAAVKSWTQPPKRIIDSPTGQLALFDLAGMDVTVDDGAGKGPGVRYDDEHRTGQKSAKVTFKDWSDQMWLPDLSLAEPRHRMLREKLARRTFTPGDLVSFRVQLDSGDIDVARPRLKAAEKARFVFKDGNQNYAQSFSDRVEWTKEAASLTMRLTPFTTTQQHVDIVLKSDAHVCIANLPNEERLEPSPKVRHFEAYYELLQRVPGDPRPVPEVEAHLSAGKSETTRGVEPVFCLMAILNQAEM